MNINPQMMRMIQLIKMQRNPQQMMLNMLQQQSNNNPMMNNLLNLAQNENNSSIEQIARNIMKERGLDFDTEFNNFKKTFGL